MANPFQVKFTVHEPDKCKQKNHNRKYNKHDQKQKQKSS